MAHDEKHGHKHEDKHAHEPTHAASHMRNPGGAHEHRDINVRAIFGFLITLTVVAMVIQFGLWGMFRYLKGSYKSLDPERNPMLSGVPQPPQKDPIRDFPQPRLQADPVHDVNRMRVTEDKLLSGPPTWVDEQAGVVRIPIEQAMKLTLERGLPMAPSAPPPAAKMKGAPKK
jgi:ABC-type nickel/cobalt efflux system permease component RcnA